MDTTKTDKRRRENRSEEARKAQTAAAVAATKARGITPREKGRENEETVLRWLADWGFSSPLLLSKLVGSQSIKRIEKNGLIERVETGSVFYPILYRLSGLGLQFANELVDMDAADRYDEIDSARIRLDKARHELTTQHLTIKAKMMDNSILPGLWHMENYWTERQFTDLFTDVDGKPIYAKNAKLPDAVWGARDWMTDEFMLVAVEIELTKKGTTEPHGKTRYKLDQFIYRVLHSLEEDKVGHYLIASRNEGILNSYKDAMTPGRTFRTWEKDRRGHWQPDKEFQVPDLATTKISYYHIPDDGRRL